ncbi:Protein E6 [Rhynchospora pubera]|uniref:Protein E6 n=1 Tax=Rhynchospora pubera TaxID=906938 RepID=A0AAV8DVM3_9POAL|nr:Protein E6 [Rhynchospora pubera]
MASCTKQVSLTLFLFLSFSLFFNNATAGRYFFSKVTRNEKPTNSSEAVPESTISEEKHNSENFSRSSQSSGYGLYGRGPEEYSPTTTVTDDNAESIANEKLLNRNGHAEYTNQFDNTNDDSYKFSNEFIEGRNGPNYDQRNKQFQYGMSDTRFMENGRYYYDVNGRRYGFGSESNPMRTNADEYRSYGSYGGGGKVGRYGNEGYANENGNEYEKVFNENEKKGENDWSQEYIP